MSRTVQRVVTSSGGVAARAQAGMTTVEYAVGTMAAAAFAAVLIVIVKSGPVKSALASVITTALSSAS